MRTNRKNTILTALVAVVLASCGTGGWIKFPNADEQVSEGKYREAREKLTHQRKTNKYNEYNLNNEISYQLDQGFLAHYAGDYAASTENLLEAERQIEASITKSVSERAARVVKGDLYSIEYTGEQYEDFYINVFTALNYYQMGKIEDAQVEIRKMYDKMNYFQATYTDRMVELGGDDWQVKVNGAPTYYYKSALGSYMGMLFFRGYNNDFARIDAQSITEAYNIMPEVYRNPLPRELVMRGNVNDELAIPDGMARLNFLSFTGLVPLKSRGRTNYRYSTADRIEVAFSDGRKMNLSLLEPITTVVYEVARTREYYQSAEQVLMAKLHGGIKTAGTLMELVTYLAFQDLWMYGKAGEYVVEELRNMGKDYDSKDRSFDRRMGRYIPGKAYVGGINMRPGTYSFTVNYYEGNKLLHSRKFENVDVQAGKLNLVNDVFLKYEEINFLGFISAEVLNKCKPMAIKNLKWDLETYGYTWDPVPGAIKYIVCRRSTDDEDFFPLDETVEPSISGAYFRTYRQMRIVALSGTDGFLVSQPINLPSEDWFDREWEKAKAIWYGN